MKKNYFVIIFSVLVILLIIYILFPKKSGVSDRVIEFDSEESLNDIKSGESLNNANSGDEKLLYDVISYDDSIEFVDQKGNSIMFIFSDSGYLQSVLSVFYCDSEEETKVVYNYFLNLVGNGEVKRVTTNYNIVSVVMDMEHYRDYTNIPKDEFVDIISSIIEE